VCHLRVSCNCWLNSPQKNFYTNGKSTPSAQGYVVFWVVAIALLSGCLGCAGHRRTNAYALSKFDSQYFLLSPDALNARGDHQTLRIPRSPEREGATAAADCSIKGPWFSFYADPASSHNWVAETPSASASQQSAGTIDMKEQWQSFERALYGLQQNHCFASVDEYLSVKERITASVSAPAGDTLFYRYGFGPGGYVDLAPGMQLQIERDFFGQLTAGQQSSTDYRGTTITYYEVSGSVESGIRLGFLRTDKRSAGSTVPDAVAADLTLATDFAATPRLRLFLEDLAVAGNAKSPAILIGARTTQELNDAAQAIAADPAISCKGLLRLQVTCAFFDGVVTVSPMLQVVVNGASTYVPIGSRLWFVLPPMINQPPAFIRTLRVKRSFDGKPVEVHFAHDNEDLSQLLLFGGDRISWSKSAVAKR
jgi:hypothetical protein